MLAEFLTDIASLKDGIDVDRLSRRLWTEDGSSAHKLLPEPIKRRDESCGSCLKPKAVCKSHAPRI